MSVKNKISIRQAIGQGYDDFWNCKKRYCVIKGSRGSKKSKTAAIRRITRIIKYPMANYLCVRRYQNTLRNSIFADTKWAIRKLGLEDYFESTVSPMEITYIPLDRRSCSVVWMMV